MNLTDEQKYLLEYLTKKAKNTVNHTLPAALDTLTYDDPKVFLEALSNTSGANGYLTEKYALGLITSYGYKAPKIAFTKLNNRQTVLKELIKAKLVMKEELLGQSFYTVRFKKESDVSFSIRKSYFIHELRTFHENYLRMKHPKFFDEILPDAISKAEKRDKILKTLIKRETELYQTKAKNSQLIQDYRNAYAENNEIAGYQPPRVLVATSNPEIDFALTENFKIELEEGAIEKEISKQKFSIRDKIIKKASPLLENDLAMNL